MTIPRRSFSLRSAVLGCAFLAAAAQAADDRIQTDRPDFVESVDVVGRGRLQIETGVERERDNRDGNRHRTYTTPTLVRIGVSDSAELRLETDGRTIRRSDDVLTGTRVTERGYGDLSVGVKWHVQETRGTQPGLAWLLHADLDSGSAAFRGSDVRPSVRLAAEWELPCDMSV